MTENNNPFWLKDMIVLGHGAPNYVKKVNDQGRCACIWSEKTGYCRIHPIPNGYLYDWEVIDVEVRKPKNDGRENTFIIYNFENDWNKMYLHIKVHKDDKGKRLNLWKSSKTSRDKCIKIIEELGKDSFSDVKNNKRSFGIISPASIEGFLERNKKTSIQQKTLFDDNLIMNQKDYKWIPCIRYSCSTPCLAKNPIHKSKIIEWGCYKWMIKNPNNEEHCKKVFDNLEINKEGWKNYLLIGNIRMHPKSYIIVKVIRFKK